MSLFLTPILAAIQLSSTAGHQQVAAGASNYQLKGSAAIRPSKIWDDGSKTYLSWPEGVEAPAIFAIDSSGNESLVNSFYRADRYVIDAVHSRLVFRLDRLTARADRKAGRQ